MEQPESISKLAFNQALDKQFTKTSIWNLIGLPAGLSWARTNLKTDWPTSILIGIAFVILIFVVRFLFYLVRLYIALRQKSNLGEAIILLNEAFSTIHWYRNQVADERKFILTMERLCNNLKAIYDRKTQSKCAVSIKLSAGPNFVTNDSQIINICRDTQSLYRNTNAYTENQHLVSGNTCFREIVASLPNPIALHYYLNNNIPKSVNYQNSGKHTYMDQILPYKSELVVPIKPLYKDAPNKSKAVGFLCLDSNKTNVFDNRYDLAMLQGVADGIFDLLLKRIMASKDDGSGSKDQSSQLPTVVEQINAPIQLTPSEALQEKLAITKSNGVRSKGLNRNKGRNSK